MKKTDPNNEFYAMAFRVLKGDTIESIATDFGIDEGDIISGIASLKEEINSILRNAGIIHQKINIKNKIESMRLQLQRLNTFYSSTAKIDFLLLNSGEEDGKEEEDEIDKEIFEDNKKVNQGKNYKDYKVEKPNLANWKKTDEEKEKTEEERKEMQEWRNNESLLRPKILDLWADGEGETPLAISRALHCSLLVVSKVIDELDATKADEELGLEEDEEKREDEE